jgi:5-oxoprolinase (ATP-hydrolysing)
VLSSSALRARVRARPAPESLILEVAWELPAGFFAGWRLRRLGEEDGTVVTASAEGGREVVVASATDLAVGDALELASPEEAPVLAARLLTGTPAGERLPALSLRLATTRATNALLERRGAPVAFFVTAGFGDLLGIGNQQRPELFALDVVKPVPLTARVIEVPERLAADGSVLRALDLEAVAAGARAALASGCTAAAIALLHSYRNPTHEQQLAAHLRQLGFAHVAVSSELVPRIQILPRAETAVVEATLAPILAAYLARVEAALGAGELHLMTSAGGLVRAEAFRAKDSLLSGPAGGVVGAVTAGRRAGFARLITFDMGGTSSDVARFEGDFDYRAEHRVGGARLAAPALAIETVAAGGGSICRVDGRQLKVGPASAGAVPGPACYGAGGPLTVTDVNLLLGRLFPEGFGIPLDRAASAAAFASLQAELGAEGAAPEALLEGLLAIAEERMAEAIRSISVARGFDPAEHALLAFGGAGGQHACALAELLGMTTVLVPPDAGLLSAFGLGQAVIERFAERQVLAPFEEALPGLAAQLAALAAEALAQARREEPGVARWQVRRRELFVRVLGQEGTLALEVGEDAEPASLRAAFEAAYRALYGYRPEGRLELESLRVIVSSPSLDAPGQPSAAAAAPTPAGGARTAPLHVGGAWVEAALLERPRLPVGSHVSGPALVLEAHATTWVPPGWSGRVDGTGMLILEHRLAASPRHAAARPEAVELELFTHRFESVAAEMGEQLRRTARSTNVKERLDFSCGLLDPAGRLVANAPHIPVHLGALGLCVRTVREHLELAPGDVVVTNHPAFGGSHLPDVTVITPVFEDETLLGYVASRAHHAEIGGASPGSMPPRGRRLEEEGVVLAPTWLVRRGEARWAELEARLRHGPFPSRNPAENLADLAAAVAANHRGATALRALARRHGRDAVRRHMAGLELEVGVRVQEALGRLGRLERTVQDALDDGTPLAVGISLADGRARFDFTGSGGTHPGNLNAPPAVVRSAVLYALRLLLDRPLPLNEGLLAPVELVVPEGLLAPPFTADPATCPAVVGGNVETSQRLVNLLLRGLGLAAGSQGTMNNVLFGNARFGYYETVAGGCGATARRAGASAVHSHMTNTRITDPEILEQRYPVRLERFAVRRGSGGAGRQPGGDGVVRELTFLEPMSLSILSQHRERGPHGMAGGEPGSPGRQRLLRASGAREDLPAIVGAEVEAGDRLVLETPGGGGWGNAQDKEGTVTEFTGLIR